MAAYGCDKPGHYFAEDYLWCDKIAFDNFYKFCFVRDPISRFVSAYNFLSEGGTADGDRQFKYDVIDSYKNINDFIMGWVSDSNILKKEHFIPQVYFTHINGVNAMDFIGRYENIEEDYAFLRSKLQFLPKLPMLNKGKVIQGELLPEAIERLECVYRLDFEAYGYDVN
ncbi:sulfotransferase family 2 domain-containing protein [Thalassolituus oleivorans]|uniref:sulfotransferase family 2 domain-containing protein n=1 Tax=Thalassolituus oleivorans TaxID=187493 RepID=UPI00166FFBF5|nr:sulfotransferase family 2 domain-containing protein [Thalassolituus oleivorans]